MSHENDAEAFQKNWRPLSKRNIQLQMFLQPAFTHIEKYINLSHMLAIIYAQNQTDNQKQQQQQKITNLWKL